MIYVIVVLVVLLAVAAIFGAAKAALASNQKKDIEALKGQIGEMVKNRLIEKAATEDALARKDKVISDLKAEVAELEKDLAANRDPAAVRSRLSKLLSDP